jgi:hypothetical protein
MKNRIKNFLQSEEGFFSLIGSAIGGLLGGGAIGTIGSAIGGGIGSLIDEKRARKQAAATDRDYYVKLRANALRGGFHPLEALRAGGGGGYGSEASLVRSKLGTSIAKQNAHDTLQDVLSGDYARRREKEDLDIQIRRTQLDQLRRQPVGGFSAGVGAYHSDKPKTEAPELADLEDRPEGVTAVQAGYRHPGRAQDAEDYEAAYGEAGGLLQGVTNLYQDSRYRKMLEMVVKNGQFENEEQANAYYVENPDEIYETLERLNQQSRAQNRENKARGQFYRSRVLAPTGPAPGDPVSRYFSPYNN